MKRGYLRLFPLVSILLFAWTPSHGQAWSGIVAPDRAIDWTTAGIPGGIPNRTTICATVTSSATTAQVQAAVNNCPVGQVVSFGAGTFNIGSIRVTKGITLRGQGPTQTYLNVTGNVQLGMPDPSTVYAVNWTGGLTRGSRVLSVSNTTGMTAGMTISLDELNPAWIHTMGINGDCGSANPCGRGPSSPWWWSTGSARALGQLTKIVSVDSSTQITVKDAVAYTHTPGLSPQVLWWSSSYGNGNIEGAGIENMKVFSNGTAATVDMNRCDFCYARNLSITQNGRGAIRVNWSYGDVIRDSYIDSTNVGAPTQYGFELVSASKTLLENNIAYTVTAPIMPETSFGTVFAYNYTLNRSALMGGNGFQFPDGEPHLAQNAFQLWEGNVMATINYDIIWGSASHGTIFRNRLYAHQPGMTNNSVALMIAAYNRYMNVVANALGDTSFNTVYRCVSSGQGVLTNHGAIYDLGNPNRCQGGTTAGAVSYDPVTYSSLMRWGNWDAVTYKANGNTNGIRYCTGSGSGNSACTEDERGSGDSTFPALPNPSSAFPASFYNGVTAAHASCGTGLSFWKNPSTGYCPTYPPIGPDVTCTANCQDNAGGRAAKIPAQLCYENSAKNANGYLTAFDGNACYANDGTPSSQPEPPSALVVQ
ncbi:MAG: hypothetical protein U1F09_05725 [Steroidobacteraceae bacterium]